MARLLEVHPTHPQPRRIAQAVDTLRAGGVIAYPTDSSYAFACRVGEREAEERIRRLRGLGAGHEFTLACRDLTEIGVYARIDNTVYRLLKAHTPGPYTFILRASRELPRRLQHPRRRIIGVRVPAHPVARALLERLGEPLLTVTARLPDAELPETDPWQLAERVAGAVDLVLAADAGGVEPTSVVDLSGEEPVVVREGVGDVSAFVS